MHDDVGVKIETSTVRRKCCRPVPTVCRLGHHPHRLITELPKRFNRVIGRLIVSNNDGHSIGERINVPSNFADEPGEAGGFVKRGHHDNEVFDHEGDFFPADAA